MTFGSRRVIVGVVATACVWILSVTLVTGQAAPPQAPVTAAEDRRMSAAVFKNVQVLRGIPVDEFMGTMGVFSAALGFSCEDCHTASSNDWANYATDTSPRKQMARRMVVMTAALNRANFGGRQVVTCFTCHRGSNQPKVTASLDMLYAPASLNEEPDGPIFQMDGAAAAEKILDKYLQALGGAQRVAALTSYVAKGTYGGYGPDSERRPVEIYAKAPGQRAVVVRDPTAGDAVTTFDGTAGAWIAAPFRPVDVLTLHGAEVDAVKVEAHLAFPARIKETLTGWRVGLPATIEGRQTSVVQGTSGGALATLYFDDETGLLTRLVRSTPSPGGPLPSRIDYSDYRDVAGVKVPFKWTTTWLDGRSTYELSGVQPNTAIPAARFARPAPPKPY